MYDDKDKANEMNNYFATIGEKLASRFPEITENPIASYLTRVTPTIENVNLNEDVFFNKLNKINIKKAGGPDNITSREMRIIAKEFSHGISFIGNLSYREGNYPSKWKIGNVKTIFKNGDKEDCSNYRPLTMLSIPSKITESVICETLDPH